MIILYRPSTSIGMISFNWWTGSKRICVERTKSRSSSGTLTLQLVYRTTATQLVANVTYMLMVSYNVQRSLAYLDGFLVTISVCTYRHMLKLACAVLLHVYTELRMRLRVG